MDTSPPSPTSLLSFASLSSLSPYAYSACSDADRLWKFKNAKYLSTLVKKDSPSIEDLRRHIKYIKDPQFTSAYGPFHVQPNCEIPHCIRIQYSQVFCHLNELLDKFQDCISEISPLKEEDLLFLLLRRFAHSSNATVYAEIRRPEGVQVYDSAIEEPLKSVVLEGSLSHDTSIIHADLSMDYREPQGQRIPGDKAYTLLPETPSETHTTCTVTVNFPAVMPIENSDSLELPLANPPEYTSPPDWAEVWPEHNRAELLRNEDTE